MSKMRDVSGYINILSGDSAKETSSEKLWGNLLHQCQNRKVPEQNL